MQNLFFLNSHPIQYNAPLYQKIASRKKLSIHVFYCSDESIRGSRDKEFNVDVKWNIPLLEGYSFSFLKNHSWKPSIHNGFFGLINLGIVSKLFTSSKSIIVVHGWAYLTNVLAIIFGKLFGHTIYLRGESPYNQEVIRSKKNKLFKRIFLKMFLFCFVDKFLYIGEQNKRFYLSMGVKEENLVFTPYTVDNERFQTAYKSLYQEKAKLKEKMNIPAYHKVILYVGKYIPKKRPMDLLLAFSKLKYKDVSLVMVGEGELRHEMEKLIHSQNLQNVHLTGFINQADITQYYAVADVFIMCSDIGETWGLSVNEAMNFALPIVVSDLTGCSLDLVKNSINGYVFETGHISQLASILEDFCGSNYKNKTMGEESLKLIDQYSYDVIIKAIDKLTVPEKLVQA